MRIIVSKGPRGKEEVERMRERRKEIRETMMKGVVMVVLLSYCCLTLFYVGVEFSKII